MPRMSFSQKCHYAQKSGRMTCLRTYYVGNAYRRFTSLRTRPEYFASRKKLKTPPPGLHIQLKFYVTCVRRRVM